MGGGYAQEFGEPLAAAILARGPLRAADQQFELTLAVVANVFVKWHVDSHIGGK